MELESSATAKIKIGIIGGTGLENPEILRNAKSKHVTTPFGHPSDPLKIGEIDGVPCVLISRHGREHDKSPTKVNYRANIWALFKEGVTHIITSTACGSLRENVKPGDLVFIDGVIDRTSKRDASFYDGEPGHPVGVCHIPMHPLFDARLRQMLAETAQELGYDHHTEGVAVCIEGPRFSTKAESLMYRTWGDTTLVNMTLCPEVVLARELGIPYASTALVTDYDCWRDDDKHPHVSVDLVMKTFAENAVKAQSLFRGVVKRIAGHDWTEHLKAQRDIAIKSVMLPEAIKTVAHFDQK